MSWKAIKWARQQTAGTTIAKFVLVNLAHYADERGYCWPSQETIASDIESSVDSVQRAIKQYLEPRLLHRIKRKSSDGRRVSHGYQLHLHVSAGGKTSSSGAAPCGLAADDHYAAETAAAGPQTRASPDRSQRPKYSEDKYNNTSRRILRDTSAGERLKKRLGEVVFNAWFADVTILGERDQLLMLEAKTRFFATRIEQQYEPQIIECLQEDYPGAARLKVSVRREVVEAGGTQNSKIPEGGPVL